MSSIEKSTEKAETKSEDKTKEKYDLETKIDRASASLKIFESKKIKNIKLINTTKFNLEKLQEDYKTKYGCNFGIRSNDITKTDEKLFERFKVAAQLKEEESDNSEWE